MTIARQNLPDKTIKLIVTIPKTRIKEVSGQMLAQSAKEIEVPGFRKGKAPQKIAEKKIDQEKLAQRVINQIIPEVYQEVLKKENLKPIINPKIKLISTKKGEDWQIEIQLCEAPVVNLTGYQDKIKKENAGGKIWTPDKGTPAKQNKDQNSKDKDEQIQKIIEILIKTVELEIPALLLEDELNRRLAALVNKTESLGMTLEQYLASTNQSVEKIREGYKKSGEEFWKIELILNKIADEEKIAVDQAEIEKLIQAIKDEKEKKAMTSQKYLVAQMLRRQKTIDFLLGL